MNSNPLPLVSIITPVFNGARFLDDLILSVQEQDYPNIEHIIIDDGSTDDGATIAVLKKYPHLHWWSRPNKGQYFTMNEGLLAAQGEIICFVSADDRISTGAVSIAANFLNTHPAYKGVYGNLGFIDHEGKELKLFQPMKVMPITLYPYSLHISHSSFYIQKNALIDNNLLFSDNLNFVGDYSWIVHILQSKIRVEKINFNLSMIRIHDNQTSKTSFYSMRKEMMFVQKRLGVSLSLAFFFRKIWFLINIINVIKVDGVRSSLEILLNRLRMIINHDQI